MGFTSNAATDYGGVAQVDGNGATLTLTSSTVTGSEAGIAGGAFYANAGASITLSSVSMTTVTADSLGGAIAGSGLNGELACSPTSSRELA